MNAPARFPKFTSEVWTAREERRASVGLRALETLWFNTGTLCNITCANCYIESSPRNDRLAYLSLADVTCYLDEIERDSLPTRLIGFTGGEPFMNAAFPSMLEEALGRGFETLTLTNAMQPMMRWKQRIATLVAKHGEAMRVRVSLDDHRVDVHDRERGTGSYAKTMQGLQWLISAGVTVELAGRRLSDETEHQLRHGFARILREHGIVIDAHDPRQLVLFPEMTDAGDPPEITPTCWEALNMSPSDIMCATGRMVVKRKGEEHPAVVACTLLPYDERFELGATLAEAHKSVHLAHRHCATFCVLGGAGCGQARESC
jgi:MoaA/NifB/PqqE/SkfB family radical SAM enzyme